MYQAIIEEAVVAIEVKISMELLAHPDVSAALQGLTRALGDAQAGRRGKRAAPESPTGSWSDFLETTTPATRDFLNAVRQHGTLKIGEAISALGIEGDQPNKAMGGLTGAFSRKVVGNGFKVPYKQKKDSAGNRIWVWDQPTWDENVVAGQANGVTA